MMTPRTRIRAFTIVELLVVIAVIGVLVGLVMPALSGAQKRSRKTTELNHLKHIGHAWNLYAINNADAALPGFLEPNVQAPPVQGVSRGWGVTYEYPNHQPIQPAPNFDPDDPENNIAGPWTWRLLSYLDYNHDVVHGYADEADHDMINIANDIDEAREIAYEPAFGYNGYYVGGWWEMVDVDAGPPTPRYKFYDHCGVNDNRALSVATAVPHIRRSSEFVIFCSSTKLDLNPSVPYYAKLPPDRPGSHFATPPIVAEEQHWSPGGVSLGGGGTEELAALGDPLYSVIAHRDDVHAPIGRHTGQIAVLYADGHIDTQGYNGLNDQSKWINSATRPVGGSGGPAPGPYMHHQCAGTP